MFSSKKPEYKVRRNSGVIGFQSRFFVLANENRTQDAGHALLRQGRNPKVRKNSGVIIP